MARERAVVDMDRDGTATGVRAQMRFYLRDSETAVDTVSPVEI